MGVIARLKATRAGHAISRLKRASTAAFYAITWWFALTAFVPIAAIVAVFVRRKRHEHRDARLVWGSAPIINYPYWSRAMREAGWCSTAYTDGYAHTINGRDAYDELVADRYPHLSRRYALLAAFLESLGRFDVFFISFGGYMLGATPLWRLEALLLHLARKKIVVMPFGGDAFVYRRVRSLALLHGLLMSMPWGATRQAAVADRVDHWVRHADAVIPAGIGPDGFGRWDVLTPNSLCIDLSHWQASKRSNGADGVTGPVIVLHAPNFRGFKGSEFLVAAVERLRDEGLRVELRLLEGVQNQEVRRRLAEETDILVDQLIATGHGLNAIEGMASGIPVVCNLEDDAQLLPFRRWSFLGECPIVSASPETITDVLRTLVTRPELRRELSRCSRAYAEKYHGHHTAGFMYGAVIEKLYGRDVDLLNLFHPLLGDYPRRLPRIETPLVNNRVPR